MKTKATKTKSNRAGMAGNASRSKPKPNKAKSRVKAPAKAGTHRTHATAIESKMRKQKILAGLETPKSNNLMLTTLAIGAAGIVGYLGFEYYHRKKMGQSENTHRYSVTTFPTNDTTAKPASDMDFSTKKTKHGYEDRAKTGAGEFPLKKGSKGASVRKIQQALLDKYGSDILPHYGADGDFGSEMAGALKKLGLPSIITQSTYHAILQGDGSGSNSNAGTEIAEKLYMAIQEENSGNAIAHLKEMENKEDYVHVNSVFKENYRVGGVHKTLVNAMLDSFSDETQKQQIRYEFLRMGLQYNGSKWSLSGVDGLPIITIYPTTVWANSMKTIAVPAKMVLGNEVGQKTGFTLFENDGNYFMVQTAAVKYLN